MYVWMYFVQKVDTTSCYFVTVLPTWEVVTGFQLKTRDLNWNFHVDSFQSPYKYLAIKPKGLVTRFTSGTYVWPYGQ